MTADGLVHLLAAQAVQLTVVVAIIGLAGILLRRRPHLVYALWLAALVKCFVLPVWSSPTGLFSWAAGPTATSVGALLPQPSRTSRTGMSNSAEAAASAELHAISTAPVAFPNRRPAAWATMIIAPWLSGAVAVLTATGAASARLSRRLRRSAAAIPADLSLLAEDIRRDLGIRRRARLLVCDAEVGPALIGTLQATIVLPRQLLEGHRQDLRAVLAHELGHLRRGDALVAAAQRFAVALWWFHPMVWLISERLTAAREQCCDEETVAGLRLDPAAYVQTLFNIARRRRAWTLSLYPGADSMKVTKHRMGHLMDDRTRFHRRPPRAAWGAWAAAAFLLLPGAALNWQRTASGQKPAPTTAPNRGAEPTGPGNIPGTQPSAQDRALAAQLNRELPEVKFDGVGFSDVIDFLRDVSGVPIYIDWPRLDFDRNAPVTLDLKNAKFSKVMGMVLAQVGDDKKHPDYAVAGDMLVVSTPAGLKAFAASPGKAVSPALQAKLARRLPEVKFDGVGLADALDFMKDVSGISIDADWKALKEAGVDRNSPVNVRVKDISVGQALHILVRSIKSTTPLADFIYGDKVIVRPVPASDK